MEALINFVISLVHFLKYDITVNKHRSFAKDLCDSVQISDDRLPILKQLIEEQLSVLTIQGNGKPAYAYFKRKKETWFDIYIINKEKMFYCRLEPVYLQHIALPDICFIDINDF